MQVCLRVKRRKLRFGITLQWKEQISIEPMLRPVQLCQLSGWEFFLFTASCLRNKNVFKLEAGLLEKIRSFEERFEAQIEF